MRKSQLFQSMSTSFTLTSNKTFLGMQPCDTERYSDLLQPLVISHCLNLIRQMRQEIHCNINTSILKVWVSEALGYQGPCHKLFVN